MSLLKAFWRSFNEARNTLDEHFSEFAEANDLSEEDIDAIRTDIVTTLVTYFAHMVEDIHQAEEHEGRSLSPLGKLFHYFAADCLQLEDNTKTLLARSIDASAEEFDDDDDDDDGDDYYQVIRFLKALVRTTPGPDKDYIDLDQDTDEEPDPYGNRFFGGVKVFDRRANRYGHGPNESTVVINHPLDDDDLKGDTPAAKTLHPNSMPSYSHGLSIAHHAVPGLTQYCDDNDISCTHLGMGPGVQHFGFRNGAERNKAAQYAKQMFGRTSFKTFTRQNNESAALQAASDLEESITHGIDKHGQKRNHDRLVQEALKHMRKTAKASSYGDGAMAAVRDRLQASATINAENPLFDNDTSRDPQFLARVDEKRR